MPDQAREAVDEGLLLQLLARERTDCQQLRWLLPDPLIASSWQVSCT
jgi:hypothetical protein